MCYILTISDSVPCGGAASSSGGLRAEPAAREQFRQGQQLYAFSGGGRLEPGEGFYPKRLGLH